MFVGVNSQLNRSLREQALEAAQMRDQSTYQLALIYRAQNQPDQAVPLLMEILRSQQPTRDLGQRAYQQLFELGFVNEPYAGQPAATPAPEGE
jgi:thioredoxin-like negative regulator of GroEL